MRTVKLFAVAFMMALAGAAYAVGAMQDGAKPRETGKAETGCCRKQAATPAPAHALAKHCAGCRCEGDSCRGASHAARHDGTWAGATKTVAAPVDEASCCAAGSACCAGGSCCKGHANSEATVASGGGESCCEGAGKNCRKAHDAVSAAAAGAKDKTASCPGGSCGCGRTQGVGR